MCGVLWLLVPGLPKPTLGAIPKALEPEGRAVREREAGQAVGQGQGLRLLK